MIMDSMTSLFEPRSIAVIGATVTEGKSGYFLLANLIKNGYKGSSPKRILNEPVPSDPSQPASNYHNTAQYIALYVCI